MASDIESAIFAFLGGTVAITNLLGSKSQGSIYPVRLDKDAVLPAMVYHRVSAPSIHSKDGDMGLGYPRFQFTVWAVDYLEAKAAIAAVRNALNAYVGPGSFQGVTVDQIIVENEQDLNDPQSLEYGRSLDAIFWIHE